MSEEAKAAKEIAKTTGKIVDVAKDTGSFLSKFISGPLEQCSGIVEDKLKYIRWERQVRFTKKADEFLKQSGTNEPTRKVDLKLALPIIQGACIEEDDHLQDMWAKLFVNAANADSGVYVTRYYVSVLERLDPYQANLLNVIYSAPEDVYDQKEGLITEFLPDSYLDVGGPDISAKYNFELDPNLEIALRDLGQMDLVIDRQTWSGIKDYTSVYQTKLGRYFYDACRLKNDEETEIPKKKL